MTLITKIATPCDQHSPVVGLILSKTRQTVSFSSLKSPDQTAQLWVTSLTVATKVPLD